IFESGSTETDKNGKKPTVTKASLTSKKTDAKTAADKTKQTRTSKIKVKGDISETLEGELTIIPDADTNALIIRTSPRNYPAILEVINKLDLLPQQVLIEVLIVDLTVDESTKIGMEWALQRNKGSNIFTGGLTPTKGTLGSSLGTVTSSFLSGGSLLIQEPGRLIAQLQAFARDSKTNILANPILVTSDNKAASISITDEIPIESTTISTPTAGQPLTQTTIEFRDVGIKLDILPKINSDNFVNLKISQEISSRGLDIGGTPSFNVRSVNTEVVLKDNQVLVMGGLMRTTETDSNDGIPFLKDIPYLGALFRNESTTTNKTELMLFITPHIISNVEDSQFVTKQFQKKLGNLKRFKKRG
ncbi:MAG: type II secretion system protein GspD, partial [Nitrospinaceae bacterium]